MTDMMANTDAGRDATVKMVRPTQPRGSARSYGGVVAVINVSLLHCQIFGSDQYHSSELVPLSNAYIRQRTNMSQRASGAPAAL